MRIGESPRARRVRVANAPRGARAVGARRRADRRSASTASPARGRVRRRRGAASPPGCIRWTTRCSIATATCTSPTAARAASRCRCRSSACGRTARARRSLRPRQSDVDGDRAGRRSVRVEPVRGHGVPGEGRRRESSRSRPTSASRAAWRSIATARCSSAIAPARSSASIATGRRRRFASVPSSVAAFHLAFGPDGALYVTGADAVAVRLGVPDRSRRRGHDPLHRRSAGRRGLAFDPHGDAVCRRSARRRERAVPAAASWPDGASANPSWCSPAPGSWAWRSIRRRRRGLFERHGVSPAIVRLTSGRTESCATSARSSIARLLIVRSVLGCRSCRLTGPRYNRAAHVAAVSAQSRSRTSCTTTASRASLQARAWARAI